LVADPQLKCTNLCGGDLRKPSVLLKDLTLALSEGFEGIDKKYTHRGNSFGSENRSGGPPFGGVLSKLLPNAL
jgi:hypothetical protein